MEKFETKNESVGAKLAAEHYDVEAIRRQAWELISSRDEVVHDDWELEPDANARSALFEALTAKGHLSVIRSDEPIEQSNRRTLRRLINGWAEEFPVWEKDRRHSEIVEELIIHRVYEDIKNGTLPPDTFVITISNIPKDRCRDEVSVSNMGYGVLNDKGMVRGTSFQDGVRVIEQVSRSNSNDGSAERFLGSQGLLVVKDSGRILSNQLIATKRDFPDGIIDVQRALDAHAGPDIIYGEHRFQPDLKVPEYVELREISKAREERAENFIQKLADFERTINLRYKSGEISYSEKLSAIRKRREELVAEICVLEPAYTKDAMGKDAVVHIEKAAIAMAAGDHQSGIEHFADALSSADPRAGAVCGGVGQAEAQNTKTSSAVDVYMDALAERKNWKWKKGVCIVKECPTRPAKTEVGPCSVCRKCQRIFDNGDSPKTIYKTIGFIDYLIQALNSSNKDNTQPTDKTQRAKRAA